jgi:hypothetical protein
MKMLGMLIKILVVVFIVSVGVLGYYVAQDEVLKSTLRYVAKDSTLERNDYDLLLGSSSIQRIDSKRYLTCGEWLNRGIGNSNISDLHRYLKWTPLTLNPYQILLYAGENDIARQGNVDEVLQNYKALIEMLLVTYPSSEIHLLSIKPSPARQAYWEEFNQLNHQLDVLTTASERLNFHGPDSSTLYSSTSFTRDGIHLTAQGYTTLTSGYNRICNSK